MQTVPQELYDARRRGRRRELARSSGASPCPASRGVVAVVTLLQHDLCTLNDFNIVYIMTRGGPGAATHIFATYSYELGISRSAGVMAMAASHGTRCRWWHCSSSGSCRYLHREEESMRGAARALDSCSR